MELEQQLRRHWRKLLLLVLAVAAVAALLLSLAVHGSSGGARTATGAPRRLTSAARTPPPQKGGAASSRSRPSARGKLGVAVLTENFFDASRDRRLATVVRYPVSRSGAAGGAGQSAPYPLIVFGHGFAVTPAPYAPLLDAWVRAGYVVAAPTFPLGNENAPGGPNERDLPNQPGDINFVITKMLELSVSGRGPLASMISSHVAVAGQSDGGDSALAAAFDPATRARHIEAAAILSGAEDPFAARFTPLPGTPLLAVQGTADEVNLPAETMSYFSAATAPKFLLVLDGAGHQEPYTVPGRTLDAVASVTIAFFNRYLKLAGSGLRRYAAQRTAGPGTQLQAYE